MIWRDEREILEQRAALISKKRENYRQIHRGTAERKGVLKEFLAAPTLTQMRRILFG